MHAAGQPEITVDGDTATGSWRFEDTVIATEHRVVIAGAAFYQDRYERGADGAWRIAHTGYVRTYEAMMSLDDLPSFKFLAGPPTAGRALLTQPFAEALAEAEQIIAGAPHVKSERDLAEGYDYLAGSIQASLRLAWAYQRDFPYFVQSTGPYTKLGLDNPDTLYFHAYLRDDAEYVVTGTRGTTADLSFQVLKGDYTPAEVPDSLSAFDDRAIEVADDGGFEFRLGPGKAGTRVLHARPGLGHARRARGVQRLGRGAPRHDPHPPRGPGRRRAAAGGRTPRPPRNATRWPASSCCPGCGPSSRSPSGST